MNLALRTALGVFFTALVVAVYAVSFAAIIYTGDLAQFLDRGIGLTLLGAVVMSLVGAATLSFRGGILGPQDLPAILLASGAAGIAAQTQLTDEVVFATVTCLIAVTTLLTGVLGYLVGRFRIAHLARIIPYPVLAGFLVTTGLLLLMGGINISLGGREAPTWAAYGAPELVSRWLPVVIAALAMVCVTRSLSGFLVMPVALFAVLIAFYAFYAGAGMSMDQLAAEGFLLGPFPEGGFTETIDPTVPLRADWWIVLQYAPLILTAAVSALLGTSLVSSGLELALDRDFELNHELSGAGLGNLLASLCGGIPGYHLVGPTLLANRLGLVGVAAGLSAAGACGLLFVFGGAVLSVLPLGFFAAVIAFLGLDLLMSWAWQERRKMNLLDYGIVVLIPLVAIGYGFLTAIALGLLAACVLFIVDYGKLDIIRSQSDISTRRSLLERPDAELDILAQTGHAAKIIELSTFLFFGTSSALRDKVRGAIDAAAGLRWLILDFRRVEGFDISTRHILRRIKNDCEALGCNLILSGLDPKLMAEYSKRSVGVEPYGTVEDAIEMIEGQLIAEANEDGSLSEDAMDELASLFDEATAYRLIEKMDAPRGTVVIEDQSRAEDIYLLLSGKLSVSVKKDGAGAQVIAYVQPGAVVGEMASYLQRPRSATITAEEDSQLMRLDLDLMPQLEADRPDIAAKFHRLMAANLARRVHRTTKLVRELQA